MTHPGLRVFVASTLLALVGGCAPRGTPWPGLADENAADTGLHEGNPFDGYVSETYAAGDMWLCGPAAAHDHCTAADLAATELGADGAQRHEPHVPAADPSVDCFYVYPTVALAAAPGNVDDLSDTEPMLAATLGQAARLGEICRVVAPLYHQATLASYVAPRRDTFLDRAYDDVEAAFGHYMATHNQGRPIVLVGHSQGAAMIGRLLQRQFDVHPALREQLVVAMPIGAQLFVPTGELVGGSFSRVPVCSDPHETGCVIGYRSYIAGEPPTRVEAPDGHEEICVDPTDDGLLSRSYFPTAGRGAADVPEGIDTPYALYADLYRASCADTDGQPYLALEVVAGDPRQSPISFDSVFYQGEMGLHVWDVHVALGDLIADVRRRSSQR